MTLEQKVQQISNDTRPAMNDANRPPGCEFTPIARHIQGIPELAIPTVRMINGGTGVRGGSCLPEPVATGLPSTPASAATFNPELNRQLGDILGDEARRDGHQVMLAPSMNLHRHPFGGRNYEYQSEDPYLSGVMAVEQIKGIQAHGIHANAKHFAGNEQETQRRQMATRIPPRALHELYLLPFEMAVKDSQPASIMCAFPEINGVSACSSEDLLEATLRERWGFEGYVMSDRRALHDVGPSIKAGVDWELAHITPLHYSLNPQPGQRGNPGSEGIRAALAAGTITESDIDQMLRRRYIQMFKFGHFDTDFDALYGSSVDFAAHGQVAREIAEQAIVLLKNENNFLPLDGNVRSIALIGAEWYAGMAKLPPRSIRGDNTNVVAPYTVTPQQGLQNVLKTLGSTATVTYNSGAGTGRRAAIDLATKSDVVIVMVGDNPHELCDRETLGLPIIPPADSDFCPAGGDEPGVEVGSEDGGGGATPATGAGTDQESLMKELVAAPGVAQKMVVVLKTEGMVLMPWLDRVPALLEAWYPGQEDGNAVASILFGVRNPSGKLPMTFGNSEREAAHATREQFPGATIPPPHWLDRPRLEARYTEGLRMGYRWYEANNVTPVFPFGFGLSYTTFEYSDLSVVSSAVSSVDRQSGTVNQPSGTVNPQSPTVNQQAATLNQQPATVLTVTYTITNTGTRQGAESSQVYLTLPAEANEPSKRLVGFKKVDLMPGASETVTVTIDSSASNHPLSFWVPDNDAPVEGWANGNWRTASGDYTVHVGTSSADTPLQQIVSVSVGAPAALPAPGAPVAPSTPGVPAAPSTPGASIAPPQPGTPVPPLNDDEAIGDEVLGDEANGLVAPPARPANCPTNLLALGWVSVDGSCVPPATSPGNGRLVPPSTTPPLLMIDSVHVARVRDSLARGDPQYKSALTALEADANRALSVAPMSVMDKPVTPPSGDKHDYMSQAPFWWPDPSRPNGRPYIRRDGERNPEISRITDRENLGRLARAVSTLALAFHFTGRQEYAQHAARLVRVWFLDAATRMNPHLRFGQGIPGIAEGRSAGIIETRFLPQIIDAVTLLQGSSAWTVSDDEALEDWMGEYLTWLIESPFGRDQARRGNNQETWADVQVVALALYTGETELARSVLEDVPADIAQEFEPDGRQPREIVRTRAWDYSIFDLTAFLHLAAFGDRVGVDLWNYSTPDGRSLRKGLEYLLPFATGEQRFPHEQITEFHPSALHPVLRQAAVGWMEPRYRELAQQIGGATPRLELTFP
jgi:beta-glucosidase